MRSLVIATSALCSLATPLAYGGSRTFTLDPSAVVRVDAKGCSSLSRRGSGFAWTSPGTVVTSLHVVAGCSTIGIRYPVNHGIYRAAKVTKVLKSADLALLTVDDPPSITPLTLAPAAPSAGDLMIAWGYPISVKGLIDTEFRRRSVTGSLSTLLNDSLLNDVAAGGMPSTSLEVHFLDRGHLMPGHSGAPLVDQSGRVLAIADGGLERGAVDINWAIPIARLRQLQQSGEAATAVTVSSTALFAADVVSDSALQSFNVDVATLDVTTHQAVVPATATISCGTANFSKVRTRSLMELRQSADDPRGLEQLIAAAPGFISPTDKFDVYQDLVTGATAVVPANVALVHQVTGCTASAANGRVTEYIRTAAAPGPVQVQSESIGFEQAVRQAIGGVGLQPDPAWTQFVPTARPDGAVVRRGAYFVPLNAVVKYMFETLAAKGGTFMGVATVRHAYGAQVAQAQAQCFQFNVQNQLCNDIREDVRWLVLMTISTHLSSFPFS